MTVDYSTYPYLLGGSNGGHRRTDTTAQSNPLVASDPANMGTEARRSLARAIKDGTLEDAGVRAGEIIGWRAWRYYADGTLGSMVAEVLWPPGEVLHAVVFPNFSGVHAFKTLDQAKREYAWFAFGHHKIAFGTVALWGEVIEHTKGYRGEFGAVHSIKFILGINQKRWWQFWRKPNTALDDLRAKYGVSTRL